MSSRYFVFQGGKGSATDFCIDIAFDDTRISPIDVGTDETMKTLISNDVLA